MATFFGEILPVVSRAVDEDENTSILKNSYTTWRDAPHRFDLVQADFLVVANGDIASGFLNAYCLNNDGTDCIGYVHEKDDETNTQEGVKVFSFHCRSHNGHTIVYCLPCLSYLEPEKMWLYVNQIFDLSFMSHVKEVIILDSLSIHNYFSENKEINSPVVKSLWTSTHKEPSLFPIYEQPNTVSGLSAAVLSVCEFKEISGILYVCLTDSFRVSLSSIDAFSPLLSLPSFRCNVERKNVLHTIKNIMSSQGSENSLYV